jgi:hypothetical protein
LPQVQKRGHFGDAGTVSGTVNPANQGEEIMPRGKKVDFTAATARARHIRKLHRQLEERLHGSAWIPQEVMLGYL